MFIAVQTGDVVKSTKLSEQDYSALIRELKQTLEQHAERFNCKYELYRGDAFQIYYPEAIHAYRSALLLKLLGLAGFASQQVLFTQSLAYGAQSSVDEPFSQSMGEVFVQSGRGLDETDSAHLSISFQQNAASEQKSEALEAAIRLNAQFLNAHVDALTQKQAQVLFHYVNLGFPEQQHIADKLNMTRQNVATHLKRSGAELIKHSIHFFEFLCKDTKQ